MPKLDLLLSAVATARADSLRLTEGHPAQAVKNGAVLPLTRQTLSIGQLTGILREVAPPEAIAALESGQPARFTYASEQGPFDVHLSPDGGVWSATVTSLAARPGTTDEATTIAGSLPALPPNELSPARSAPASDRSALAVHAIPSGNPAARDAIDALLRLLVERGGSDLHLRVGEPPIIRVSGTLVRVEELGAIERSHLEEMLASIMPAKSQREFAETSDSDYAYEIEGVSRFRCNALRDRHGAAAVFRAIPSRVITVDELRISPEVQALCQLSKGLVLVTGPTGSGKSTTLCALVDHVNRTRTDHIVTIEDPIEFVHQSKGCLITQRQVGVHTIGFKQALRAALREDPDVVLVGELRDLETVAIAIETAETGHLVFGTLHTSNAASTIDRIIDQFPADRQEQVRVMLSESLKGVISQTLCKKIGGGRAAAMEVLLATPALSNLIRESKTFQIPSVMQTSRRLGMVTMNDALIELVDSKQVEPREAYLKATDKSAIANALKQRGHDTSFIESDTPQAGTPRVESGVGVKTPMPRQGYGVKR